MVIKKKFIALLVGVLSLTAGAQESAYELTECNYLNYGDGRFLFRHNDAKDTPLNGKHRLIDGYRSEYTLAEFKDGMYHGDYQLFKRTKLSVKCTYSEGRLNGVYTTYNYDGTVSTQKQFVNGKIDGMSTEFFLDGTISTEKGYKLGVEHGVERAYSSETGKLTTDKNYKDGRGHGNWIEHIGSNIGDFIKTSSYDNGIPVGEYSEIKISDGTIFEKGSYKDGKKDGLWIYNDSRNGKETCLYENGDMVELSNFFTDGKTSKSIRYKDGKKNGLTKEYFYDTGKIKYERNYLNGLEHGVYKMYYNDDAGTLKEEGVNEKDKTISRKTYHPNGIIKAVAKRINGAMETVETYNSKGKKE